MIAQGGGSSHGGDCRQHGKQKASEFPIGGRAMRFAKWWGMRSMGVFSTKEEGSAAAGSVHRTGWCTVHLRRAAQGFTGEAPCSAHDFEGFSVSKMGP